MRNSAAAWWCGVLVLACCPAGGCGLAKTQQASLSPSAPAYTVEMRPLGKKPIEVTSPFPNSITVQQALEQSKAVKKFKRMQVAVARKSAETGQTVLLPCSACDGAATRDVSEKLRVTIPAGVDDASRIRVKGKGSAGDAGTEPGDLYLVVKLEPDPVFKKDGRNLYSEVRIHALDAMLGTSVEVETLDGKASMKVPPGTQNGKRFRVKGHGIIKDGARGDLIVQVEVTVPEKLTPEQEEAMKKFAEAMKS